MSEPEEDPFAGMTWELSSSIPPSMFRLERSCG
jgi:hypothetical protein